MNRFVKDFQYVPQNFTANERAEKDLQSLTETGESDEHFDDDGSSGSDMNSMNLSNVNSKVKFENGGDNIDTPHTPKHKLDHNMDESFKVIAVTGKPVVNGTDGNDESDKKDDKEQEQEDNDAMFDH